ncbi:Rv3235 family protein [Streptomyces violaceoruber]
MSGGPGGVPSTGPGGTLSDGPGGTPPRAPGGLPPRRPGARGARAAASGGRPPGSPGRSQRSRTRPADTRPPTAGPGRGAGPAPVAGPPGAPATGSAPEPATAFAPGRPTTAAVDGGPGTASAAARTASAASAPAAAPSRGRIAPGSHRRVARPSAAPVVPAQTPRRPVPQLRPTDHFAELLLGVLSGRRPVHSMLRHTVGRAYDDLAHLAERGPLRTRGTSPVVRDIGYFEPRPGALEVFARIGAGDRLRAMAFRLERGRDLRWRCTAVEVGGPRRTRADDD